MKWSKYQQDIFDFVLNGSGNGLVSAGPGSGKTKVIEESVKRVPETESVLAICFNRHIRDELKKRLEHLPNVTVHTCNSFGNAACRPLGWYKLNAFKVNNIVKFDIFDLTKQGYTKEKFTEFCKVQSSIVKLIGLAKGHMIFSLEEMSSAWQQLADEFDVEIPKIDDFETYLLRAFSIDQEKTKVIDFDDQIAIPLRRGFSIQTFDRVFVDESQDLTPAQIELTSRAIGSKGRALLVGDRRQAIYGFRGADSRAMDNIQLMMDCTELPLSICYRCCKAVVREAQKIEPTIEWFESALEGEVIGATEQEFYKMAVSGNAVLCRTTAPLVQACLYFIRRGTKALVKGRDIGTNLEDLIKEICKNDLKLSIEDFLDLLNAYHQKEVEKLKRNNKDDKQIILEDKIDTIKAITEDCIIVDDIIKRFALIFSSEAQDDAINLMTIHKAKGLEADVVYILRPDLMPHKLAKSAEALRAEENLKYVAITRARKKLVWVSHENNSTHSG